MRAQMHRRLTTGSRVETLAIVWLGGMGVMYTESASFSGRRRGSGFVDVLCFAYLTPTGPEDYGPRAELD